MVGESIGFNLVVASITSLTTTDPNGSISAQVTGIVATVAQAPGTTASVQLYDAYASPLRPFAANGSLHGTGLTIDTSSGDGSALNFIPMNRNIG